VHNVQLNGLPADRALAVLIVDDEKILRDTLRMFLERQGCRVETAEDGVEGLEAVQVARFDIVVADVRMPRADGHWLWRETIAVRPELKGRFLFISGLPIAESNVESSGERFLAKPFRMNQMWTEIQAMA